MNELTDSFLAAQRLLVITPHADDETYGCAGTIARIKELGGEVFVLLVSVADLAHYGNGRDRKPAKVQTSASTRLQEFDAVMRLLGVDEWEVLFTDADTHLALDALPRKTLVRLFECESRLSIDRLEPTMVMLPAASYNQDHVAVYEAGLTATRPGAPSQKHTVPFVLTYDNTSLFWTGTEARFSPNFYVDITGYLDVKIKAMRMHTSQVRESLYHGSPEGLELATRVRGREISAEAAEGFELLRAAF
jgi:LmbE family N-acetylglucosaminyl deacetylase